MVGCSELGGAQARYRTPATCSPGMCVGRSGTGKPLQVTHDLTRNRRHRSG